MASEGLHEAADLLDEATVDHHRAMTSLCEELEAIDRHATDGAINIWQASSDA